ncbi:MAG: penicillin acylase family protein [Bacteroidetes bacterium]|uniref:penicillin acylase family protein n=1 Tax=Flavobacterium sp. TaxID=239 RepID=UPI002FDA2CF0|nr:penicillin acylase family protein [Bacteroidota bacterium]
MKILKKTAILLLAIMIITLLGIVVFLQFKKPNYETEIELIQLSKPTTTYFDTYGIPHIYAENEIDAQRVLGYVHAQERLWQMELMRRIAPGKLSEIFGSVMVKNDKFFVTSGIEENSEITIANLDKNTETYKLTQAYLDGINQYIAEGTMPVEFTLLGISPEKFTLKDVYNIFGFMSFSFAMAQKTDPLLTDIRDNLGMEYLADFGIHGELGKKQLKSFKGKTSEFAEISKSITAILEKSPVPAFIGSNSWVIGANKTKNRKVIFANDPHIMFAQPGTWFEAHIVTPKHEMYGYYLTGTPFPLLGHNREYAYGLTMFENDDLDLFEEKENPENVNEYLTKNGYKKYYFLRKTIKVKDSSTIVLNVKSSLHGPIISNVLAGANKEKSIAMSWIYTQQKNQILEAVYGLSHAMNLDDFHAKIELIHAPGLNIMYGDAKDNIAWITSGKLYKLDKTVNPNFILNGSNGIDDQKEFLPFSENPFAVNPPWNYVYSSNNQVEKINGYLYPGYYLPKDRALRIDTLLSVKSDWSRKDVEQMILDNTSSTASQIVNNWILTLNQNQFSETEKVAIDELKKWSGSSNLNDIAPTIYNKWIYFYLKNTFEDELGEEKFKLLLGTHIMKQMFGSQSQKEQSIWWDDITTKNKKETRSEIMTLAFKEAIKNLETNFGSDVKLWNWKKAHTLEFQHPLGQVKLLKGFFNVGPFEVPGANEVINNLMYFYSDEKINQVKAGPSTRRIIDFSDVENSVSILPSGNSGNPMSKHYNDQAEMYVNGQFRKMLLNKKEIEKCSTKMVFSPKK